MILRIALPVFFVSQMFWLASAYAQFDTTQISVKLDRVKETLGKDVAFVLYKDGKVLYKKEIGGLTIKTPRYIAASSQWLTTALVLTFVQEGKISLDDKVSNYLPEFASHFKSYITLRQCLTNYTGIQYDRTLARFLQRNNFHTLDEEVNNFAAKRDIETNAGTEFKYSNVGFNIAGRVLEIVTKRPFDRLMQDRIVRPLNMKNTTFTNEDYNDAVNPSVGARSSAADFINFLAMLLNKGMFTGKQILTEELITMMNSLQTEAGAVKYAPRMDEGLSYGMGVWIFATDAQNKATVVGVPGLNGTWTMIDLCRGYAFVIITKSLSGELDRKVYMDIKATIDESLGGSNCP